MTNTMFGREVLKLFPREHHKTGNVYRGIGIGHSNQPTILIDTSIQGEGCEGFKAICTSFLDEEEKNKPENYREFTANTQNPSHPSPELCQEPGLEQDTPDLVYYDADISSPSTNDYQYTDDDRPVDTYICVEDDLPSSAWDVGCEEPEKNRSDEHPFP